ncbi:hypothetical protein [Kutzneria kofuensis]|uniref:Uncharacterized protein n=1 Tax=Kutzneria kofuensis TaxID=103725 RepID=A0A7W9KGE3_9PSEU|nr:hypothetical protein [Kutzneria kofuensis]MBB5892125.1 hypothetical protein [Kutzneria kofuensis]
MAKGRPERIDPSWPHIEGEKHPVSELATDMQGALSPFGDVTFPVDPETLPYTHPVTEINR